MPTKLSSFQKIPTQVLDGCECTFLTYDNLRDIKTILAYDYEDGKPWHDQTCVMEIIFHNFQENIGDNRIRFLYNHPAELLNQLSQFMLSSPVTEDSNFNSFRPSYPVAIKIDLKCAYGSSVDTEEDIRKEDFEFFSCKIKHKKNFHPKNPKMPDD